MGLGRRLTWADPGPPAVPGDHPRTDVAPDAGRNPWDRFGWVMRAIWLVFLVSPLISAFQRHAWPCSGVLLVAAFVVVYLDGMAVLDRARRGCGLLPTVPLVRVSRMLATASIIGPDALGMAPFVAVVRVFALPAGGLVVGRGRIASSASAACRESARAWSFGLVVLVGQRGRAVVRVRHRPGERYQVRRRLALVAERERVARDVHDVLGHSLTVLTVKAELAERLVDVDPERAKAELAQIHDLTRQSLAEIRATVGGLRVARLADELASARRALAAAGIEPKLPDDAVHESPSSTRDTGSCSPGRCARLSPTWCATAASTRAPSSSPTTPCRGRRRARPRRRTEGNGLARPA